MIGKKAVDEITPSDALAVLEPIWTVKNETASRVRQRMEAVMDWVVSHGFRLDNPANRALLRVLPAFKREDKHHTALRHITKWLGDCYGAGIHRQPADQAGI